MVVADNKLGIKIIDVNAGQSIFGRQITPSDDSPWGYDSAVRLIWSSNAQTSASEGFGTTQNIIELACSPDSSKVVAILGDKTRRSHRMDEYKEREMTLSMWCMWSGSLVGTTSFKLATRKAAISFAADGWDILICCYDLDKQASNRYWSLSGSSRRRPRNAILLRFSVIPTHLETTCIVLSNSTPLKHPIPFNILIIFQEPSMTLTMLPTSTPMGGFSIRKESVRYGPLGRILRLCAPVNHH